MQIAVIAKKQKTKTKKNYRKIAVMSLANYS